LWNICLGCLWTAILLISAPREARITDMSHQHPAQPHLLNFYVMNCFIHSSIIYCFVINPKTYWLKITPHYFSWHYRSPRWFFLFWPDLPMYLWPAAGLAEDWVGQGVVSRDSLFLLTWFHPIGNQPDHVHLTAERVVRKWVEA
jgi:hypothetical protein